MNGRIRIYHLPACLYFFSNPLHKSNQNCEFSYWEAKISSLERKLILKAKCLETSLMIGLSINAGNAAPSGIFV